MPKSEAYLMDCMEYMRSLPDKAFDLAVVDPPYGGGGTDEWEHRARSRFGGRFDKYHIGQSRGRDEQFGGGRRKV